MYRQSQWQYQVFVQGADGNWIDLGVADGFTGGSKKGDPEMFKRGDGSTLNLGADTDREDGVAMYLFDEKYAPFHGPLDDVCGNAATRIKVTPVDDRRIPWAGFKGYSMTGKFVGLGAPEGGGGKNTAATVELTFNLDDDLVYA